jgi:predicted acyltransferase
LAALNLPADWHRLTGFASHWEKHNNLGARVDQWFVNLFPRPDGKRFEYNEGGYVTLNFVPSIATMVFGLLAGELIRSRRATPGRTVATLVGTGLLALAIGWTLNVTGICPVVKRLWTPSWAIFSTGWALLMLAAFYYALDVARWRGRLRPWAMPLVVVGMNSIAAYCISMVLKPGCATRCGATSGRACSSCRSERCTRRWSTPACSCCSPGRRAGGCTAGNCSCGSERAY